MNSRLMGLDIAKALAAMFVVVLHMNGYTMLTRGISSSSLSSRIAYFCLEGIAYIAVHLFVLSGSYLMCGKKVVKLFSILRIWLSTWLVTVIGLFIAFTLGLNVSVKSILQSLFPISFRAYGYVSSYLILMLLSPFFNIVIERTSTLQLAYISGILIVINILFPTVIPFIGWGENYTALFICLYFVASLIRKINSENSLETHNSNKKVSIFMGGCLWGTSTFALIVSPFIIKLVANYIHYFKGKELLLFNYHNVFVFAEAIGLFLVLSNFTPYRNGIGIISRIISVCSKSSLIIYLYHMHPIFKSLYPNLAFFKIMYSDNGFLYSIKVLFCSVLIYFVGIILNHLISKIVDFIVPHLLFMIKKNSRIEKTFIQCKISFEK